MSSVLYVFPSLNTGGAELTAIQVANYLQNKTQYNVTLLVFDNSDFLFSLIDEKITTIKFDISFQRGFLTRIFNKYILIPVKLAKVITEKHYKSILSIYEHDAEIAIILSRLICLFRNKKITSSFISIIQNSIEAKTHYFSLKRRIVNKLINHIRKYFFNHFIGVSPYILGELALYKIYNSTLINNPINMKCINKLKNEKIDKDKINLISDNYIIAVSRISIQKDIQFMLKAFYSIIDFTQTNLVIIGSVSESKCLEEMEKFIQDNMLENRVFYLGSVLNPYPLMQNAKLLVNTSLYEGNPLTFLEAIFLELPILTRNFNGINKLDFKKFCIIDSSNDETEYGRKILEILNNKDSQSNILYQKYLNDYDIDKIGKQYFACINNL